MKKIYLLVYGLILILAVIGVINYITTDTRVAIKGMSDAAFEAYLLTYPIPPNNTIYSSDADRCIKILHGKKSEDLKDAALSMIGCYYSDWTASQLTRFSAAQNFLTYDLQDTLIGTYADIVTDILNVHACEAYAKGWIRLIQSGHKDNRIYAVDSACVYGHPILADFALRCFRGNTDPEDSNVLQYFGYYYYQSLFWQFVDLDPENTLKDRWVAWWNNKDNKTNWIYSNADYLAAPWKYVKDGPVYAYIFGVSDYPSQWGNIDLPGVAKDIVNVEAMFKSIPRIKSVKVYKNNQATYHNFVNSFNKDMVSLPDNAIVFVYFSGHGAIDSSGMRFILPYDFDVDYNNKTYVNAVSSLKMWELTKPIPGLRNQRAITILDSCYSGSMGKAAKARAKFFSDSNIPPPVIPHDWSDGVWRNGPMFLCATRGDTPSYDTDDGGAFTVRFVNNWGKNNFKTRFNKLMQLTGKNLIKDGFPQVPVIICTKGDELISINK
jgi:hypothetical protein